MAYGYKSVTGHELNRIVDRLSSPTRASRSWAYDYNAQEEHVRQCRKRDPLFQPQRIASPQRVRTIVQRLTRPTIASTCNVWNFDTEDGNLMFLKKFDPNIRLPYKTLRDEQLSSRSGSGRSRISINDLPFFDHSRPHTGIGSRGGGSASTNLSRVMTSV